LCSDTAIALLSRCQSPKLWKLVMDEQSPILPESICIGSRTKIDVRSPFQHSQLLWPCHSLVWRYLTINLLPPSYMLTQLHSCTNWSIRELDSTPLFSIVISSELLLDAPVMTHVTLPNLLVFSFRGVGIYLEGLARISALSLRAFKFPFLPSTPFRYSTPCEFFADIRGSQLQHCRARLREGFRSFNGDPHRKRWKHPLCLRVMHRLLEWRVNSRSTGPGILSPVFCRLSWSSLHLVT
jgi:hypothetical protein